MILEYDGDERNLQIKICEKLNNGSGFQFDRRESDFCCDIIPIPDIYADKKKRRRNN